MSPFGTGGGGGGGNAVISGVTVTGTATAGQVPVASSGTAGTWSTAPYIIYSTVVVGSSTTAIGPAASSIPTGFNVLDIFLWGQSSQAAVLTQNALTFNGDTGAHYDDNAIFGNNNAAGANSNAAAANIRAYTKGSSGTATIPGLTRITVPAYASTAFWKACTISFGIPEETAANSYAGTITGGWRSTAAINQFTLTAASAGNWTAGTVCVAYLY